MSREGKLHLVESFSGPRELYKNVTDETSFKLLKEAAQKFHGKTKFSEASAINKMKRTLSESKIDKKLQQRVLQNLQEAGANVNDVELWQFPVSKVNDHEHPNLNGRVYGKRLWESVVNKQREIWQGGTGLANHPEDDEDGDFMKQSIVWLDGFIGDDGIIYGIGTFVGEGGALARQIIGVGGRVGFSTSGYGDFLADGIEVDPESYEIDRFADLVLNPSQGVFGDYSDTFNSTKQLESVNRKLKESTNKRLLKENEELKTIATALQGSLEDALGSLSNLADEMGFKLKLQEAAVEDLVSELAVKLVADTVKDWKLEDCSAEDLKDIQEIIKSLVEKGIDESEIKNMLKNTLDKVNANEEVAKAILENDTSLLQEDEEEVCPKCGKNPCECESDSSDSEDEENEDEDDGKDEDDEESEKLDEENLSLEDQLMVEHYTKALKAIGKKSTELWESKIQELDDLTTKLKETKLSKEVKTRLNSQTQKLVDSIMKEAREAIQEGFKAKKICDDLGVNSISRLSNIKEKLEDFVALEECLEKATKEANKYKALYEAKSQFANEESEEAYSLEEKVKELQEEILTLENKLAESKHKILATDASKLSTKLASQTTLKELKEEKDKNSRLYTRYQSLLEKYKEVKQVLEESEKTIKVLKERAVVSRRELAESKDQLKQLRHQLTETNLQRTLIAKSKNNFVEKSRKLEDNLSRLEKEKQQERVQQRIQEARSRAQKLRESQNFYDESKMFKNTEAIDSLLENAEVSDRSAYRGVKTLREAENKLLFSNELLSEEADHSRNSIRAPKEDIGSLADLFE